MAQEVKMPQLGLTMEEGTIGKWHKNVGDEVKKGEILLEITTDKITTEMESEFDGILLDIVAKEGEDVPVQGIIAYIGNAGEQVGKTPAKEDNSKQNVKKEEDVSVKQETVNKAPQKTNSSRIKISPLAKKTAEKYSVDYSNLQGSGPGGRIVQKDILKAKDTLKENVVETVIPKIENAREKSEKISDKNKTLMKGNRKVVAQRMLKSHLEIPCVTQNVKIDVTDLMAFREKINENREERFSLNDFILKAVSKALSNNKHILVSIDEDYIVQNDEVNIGMAVALDDGLIVPVIKNADKMSLETIAKTSRDLSSRARNGNLGVDEYSGSTFTISNLGMYHVESFTPIINQPNAAILGVCSVEDELALKDGEVVQRKKMKISLTYDHRLLDGAVAAKFQVEIKKLLENPMEILI